MHSCTLFGGVLKSNIKWFVFKFPNIHDNHSDTRFLETIWSYDYWRLYIRQHNIRWIEWWFWSVCPTLAEVYADRLNADWHSPNDARFSVRWNSGICKHRDWNEPNRLHVYLNNAENGITRFFLENEVVEVRPIIGTAVVFDGYILHEADAAIGRKATLAIDLSKL